MKLLIIFGLFWTMTGSMFEAVCLGMAWGSPWVHGPALALQLALFAWIVSMNLSGGEPE